MTHPVESRAQRHPRQYVIVLVCLLSLVIVCCGSGSVLSDTHNRFLARLGQALMIVGATSFWLLVLAGIAMILRDIWIAATGPTRRD